MLFAAKMISNLGVLKSEAILGPLVHRLRGGSDYRNFVLFWCKSALGPKSFSNISWDSLPSCCCMPGTCLDFFITSTNRTAASRMADGSSFLASFWMKLEAPVSTFFRPSIIVAPSCLSCWPQTPCQAEEEELAQLKSLANWPATCYRSRSKSGSLPGMMRLNQVPT